MTIPHITRIEWVRLESKRPRAAGDNARLGPHGDTISLPLVRLTDNDGATGFGFSWGNESQLAPLLGAPLETLFTSDAGVTGAGRAAEFPLWDLIGRRVGRPVYQLAAEINSLVAPETLRVPCYDTSLYFDDLHLASTKDAAALMAAEAQEGYARGHRAFKLKVGRCARHLPMEEGTRRDIAVVCAVRAAVGPECALMLDANNGYTLNLAKHVLSETADCNIFWLEEAFHEDPVLYRDLKEWLAAQGLPTLIADGEGDASPHLLFWAREGLIDAVQYDIFGHGFSNWLRLGKQLDTWGVRSAPHHYGAHFGNYASGHLAPAIRGFSYVEWDEASTPALDASGYCVLNGFVCIPHAPGFGLELDEALFREAVQSNGGEIRLTGDRH